jgi:hypothetical protein
MMNIGAAATEGQRRPAAEKPRLFSATKIKTLFRAIAKAVITDKAPKPKRRRKRDEDTRGLFKKLALKILRPVVRSIFHDSAFSRYVPPPQLDDTQRWKLRHSHHHDTAHNHGHNQALRSERPNHLSLRF